MNRHHHYRVDYRAGDFILAVLICLVFVAVWRS